MSLTDLGRRVWIHLYAESTPNGNAVVNYRAIASTFNVRELDIKKAFQPQSAAKKKLIKIVTETPTVLVIGFKVPGRPTIDKPKPAKKAKPSKPVTALAEAIKEQKKQETLSVPIKAPKEAPEKAKDKSGSILISSNENDLHPAPGNFKFPEDLKRAIIAEYCIFWKELQASQQAMAGIPGDKIKTFNPLIKPIDVRNLCDISYHLYNNGFKSAELVVSAFKVIFANWHYYREFVQTGTSTTMLLRNLNEIILVNQTLKAQKNHGNRKKQQELSKKFDRIQNKDYSHLD